MLQTPSAVAPPPLIRNEIPIVALVASRFNPRKTFDQVALEELASSIREIGVVQPLVVRPHGEGLNDSGHTGYEIVAGERRYRAASLAGLTTVPCVVRQLTDIEVIKLALTENHQRRDVHPLEEAEAMQQLLDLDRACTVASIAKELGVSKSWVYGRLKLLRMTDAGRDAYRHHAITAEHADILAQVPVHQQAGALEACFSAMLFNTALFDLPDDQALSCIDVRDAIERGRWDLLTPCLDAAANLKRWVARHTVADISDEAVQEGIPELAVALADAAAEESKLLQVSLDLTLTETQAKALGVVRHPRWVEIIEGKVPKTGRGADGAHVSNKRCEHQQGAVITHPPVPGVARVLTVCMKRSCPVHRPAPVETAKPVGGSAKRLEQERESREEQQREQQEREERARIWREEQAPKYLAELKTRVMKVSAVTPAIVKATVASWELYNIKRNFGVALTPATALSVLLLSLMPPVHYNRESADAKAFGAAFGLTPDQWLKAQKAEQKTPASAKGKKSKGRPAAKKGGR
jgi:ParB/RepB/Spo0J family partition protein